MDAIQRIGKQVRVYRLENNLKQIQLSADSDVSVPTISALENGDRSVSIDKIERIAEALGKDLIIELRDRERPGL